MGTHSQYGMTAAELEASIAEEERGITLKGVGEAHLESLSTSAEGAKFGSKFGAYGALAGGIVGGVYGMGASLLGQRYSESEGLADQRLLELLRQAEAGELGLTGTEQQEIFGRLSAPMLANERAAQQQALQAAASQNVGAGAFFRGAQQQETGRAQTMAIAQQELLRQDLAKRAQQKELLEELLEKRATRLDEDAFDWERVARETAEAASGIDFEGIGKAQAQIKEQKALNDETKKNVGQSFETLEDGEEVFGVIGDFYGDDSGGGDLDIEALGGE
jgi:hypothetical protein